MKKDSLRIYKDKYVVTSLVLLDHNKAFDTLCQAIFCKKLIYFGIMLLPFLILADIYLTERNKWL